MGLEFVGLYSNNCKSLLGEWKIDWVSLAIPVGDAIWF